MRVLRCNENFPGTVTFYVHSNAKNIVISKQARIFRIATSQHQSQQHSQRNQHGKHHTESCHNIKQSVPSTNITEIQKNIRYQKNRNIAASQ